MWNLTFRVVPHSAHRFSLVCKMSTQVSVSVSQCLNGSPQRLQLNLSGFTALDKLRQCADGYLATSQFDRLQIAFLDKVIHCVLVDTQTSGCFRDGQQFTVRYQNVLNYLSCFCVQANAPPTRSIKGIAMLRKKSGSCSAGGVGNRWRNGWGNLDFDWRI